MKPLRRLRLLHAAIPKGTERLPDPFCIKPGYTARLEPEYDHEEKWGDVLWQPDVYPRVAEVARDLGATRIVDVGCGNANKLSALADFETVGIDIGSNLEVCRSRYPDGEWIEHDLDSEGPLPIDLDGAVVVCADVLEHLLYPDRLLAKLRNARAIVLSTPERNLHWGVSHMGPPPNRAHVREWAWRELAAFLASAGFSGTIELTRSRDRPPDRDTILAILESTKRLLAQHAGGRSYAMSEAVGQL